MPRTLSNNCHTSLDLDSTFTSSPSLPLSSDFSCSSNLSSLSTSSSQSGLGADFRSSSPISTTIISSATATLEREIVTYLEDPLPQADLFWYPVQPDQFWLIWSCDTDGSGLEYCDLYKGCGVNYNPKTLTLQVKRMSFGLHNVGSKWLKRGWRMMQQKGFVAVEDLADVAYEASTTIGLIEEPENKAYEGFDESTPWSQMTRTPDWSVTRICNNLASEKPIIVMEIGVSQPLVKSAVSKTKRKRESLYDRAEGWLHATNGITKAVVLIDLSECKQPTDSDIDPEAEGLLKSSCLLVTVQLWRSNSESSSQAPVEHHEFKVCRDSPVWLESDVPDEFPKGLTFISSDIYDSPAQIQTFLLPMWWLRNAIIDTWDVHVERADRRKRIRTDSTVGREVKRVMKEI